MSNGLACPFVPVKSNVTKSIATLVSFEIT
jgi:hypothetical protein